MLFYIKLPHRATAATSLQENDKISVKINAMLCKISTGVKLVLFKALQLEKWFQISLTRYGIIDKVSLCSL